MINFRTQVLIYTTKASKMVNINSEVLFKLKLPKVHYLYTQLIHKFINIHFSFLMTLVILVVDNCLDCSSYDISSSLVD